MWVNILFFPRSPNPRGKCDRQVGLELGWSLVDRWGLSSARLGSFVGKYTFFPRGPNPRDKCDRQVGLELGWSLVDRWGLSSARLRSFVGKYSFPPKVCKSQGKM